MFAKFMFIYCALVIISSGIISINLRNPVHSVLGVLVLFFHMAGLYLMLNAEFLAAVQVIVYAGAILVLYLFVVFLVDIKQEITVSRFVDSKFAAKGIVVGLGFGLLALLRSFTVGPHGKWSIDAVNKVTHTKALGQEMYTTYILPFEVVALILLIAVIGGMVLASKDKDDVGKKLQVEESK